MLVWETSGQQGFFRGLAPNGSPGPVRSATTRLLAEPPAIAGNGDAYLMVFASQNGDFNLDLSARLLRGNGTLGPEFSVQPLADFSGASVAAAGTDFLVRYFKDGGGQLRTISRTGRVGQPVSWPGSSSDLQAAESSQNTLLVWAGPESEVSGRMVVDGAFRPRTIPIAPAGAATGTVSVAFDGTRYWVVWQAGFDAPRAMIRSVNVGGRLGAPSMLVDDDCSGPRIASNGRGQLLLGCYKFSDHYRVAETTVRLVDTTSASAATLAEDASD